MTICLGLVASGAFAEDASVAIDVMPERYRLTIVDRAGVGHPTAGEWDASTALSVAWRAVIAPRPLFVGLRAQAAHRREAGISADEGALALQVGAAAPVSARWALNACADYGSGILALRGAGLASALGRRLATLSVARATVGAAFALRPHAAISLDAGYELAQISDRWTRSGVHGHEFGPVLAVGALWRW